MITMYKRNHIIQQLQKYGYTDVEGKSDKQLIHQLARLKALQVDVSCGASKWF